MSFALSLAATFAVARACAPQVAPETLLSLAKAESALDPLTIGVNAKPHRTLRPATREAAVQQAGALLAKGADFDVGLTQVNVRNLRRLGLPLADAFDPCRNVSAGAQILSEDFLAARRSASTAQEALRAALSTYNTGDPLRGLRNGYVARVYTAARQIVPSLVAPGLPEASVAEATAWPGEAGPKPAQRLDVFARPAPAALVWAGDPQPRKLRSGDRS